MKKKLSIIAMLLALSVIVLIIGSRGDEPLSPDVVKVQAFQIPEVVPEDNIYIGICGLANIDDGDVVKAGQKYLARGQSQPPSGWANDFSYKNLCVDTAGENCLNKIAAEASAINEEVQNNKEIMDRYYVIREMPLFVNGSKFSDPAPHYGHLTAASRFNGYKALLDIKQGDLSGGLDSIEKDLNFYKRISRSEYISLVDLMTAVAMARRNVMALSMIIEDGQIDISGEEERFRKMLDLNFDCGRMMTAALETEKRQSLLMFESKDDYFLNEGFSWQDKFADKVLTFFLKDNMTLNRLATQKDDDIKQIQAAPLLGFPDFYKRSLVKMGDMDPSSNPFNLKVKNLYKEYGVFFFKNYAGQVMLNIAWHNYLPYAARLNDALVHSHLVRAQLELRLMGNRPDDLSQALSHLGPEALNPYTGQPFAWDKDNNVLWVDLVAAKGNSQDKTKHRVKVEVPPLRP